MNVKYKGYTCKMKKVKEVDSANLVLKDFWQCQTVIRYSLDLPKISGTCMILTHLS